MWPLATMRNLTMAGALVVGLAAAWYVFDERAGGGGAFETKAIDTGTIERIVSASGPVNAVVTVSVGTQVSGQIAVLDVDFNSQVKKGQRLALIDPQSFQSRVVQAQSDVVAARTQKSLQEANVMRSEAQLEKEKRILARLQTLFAKGFASTEQLDAQKATIASANADLKVAIAQVDNSNANIASKEATLAQARIDLSRTEIRSPIDGIVIARSVDLGQTVAASLQAPTLFQIAQDLSQVQIEAQVDESDIGNVAAGQSATFTVGSFAQREFRGRVAQVRVGGVNLQNVVTYSVIISANNPDLKLLPGMTAGVKILTGRRENALRLPNEALRFRPPASLQAPATVTMQGQGAARREGAIKELTDLLGLTAAQQTALATALPSRPPGGPGAGQIRSGGDASSPSNGASGARQRSGFQKRIAAALEPLLTPEQKKKLNLWQSSRSNTRPAQVWVMRSGTPENVPATLGIADDRFSEIVSGDLKAGDQVVTRYSEPAA